MSYDPQTAFPSGTQFTYVAQVQAGFFSSADDVASAVSAALSQDGIQVLSSSIASPSLLSQLGGLTTFPPFSLTLICLDNNSNDVLLDAQNYCDYEIESASGNPVGSSSITSYTTPAGVNVSTGLASQAAPSSANLLGLGSLTGGQNALIAIVVIIVVLIVAVILAPEHAARAVAAFR